MVYRLLLAWLAMCTLWGVAAEPLAAQEGADREIVINLPAFRLYLYENGVRIREYPIAIGKIVEQQTVLGTTRIINRVADPTYYPRDWWRREGVEPIPPGPDNPVGTRWLGLDIPHYGIHGTNDPDSIGSPASAGCIRMYNEDVEELTDLVQIGTPVHIIYETVQIERDPIVGEWRLRVYNDLYGLGTNTLERVLDRLAEAGVDVSQVSYSGLRAILHAADGLAHPLPVPHRIVLNGGALEVDGFRLHQRVYAAARPLAEWVGESARWSPRWRVGVVAGESVRTGKVVDEEFYAPLADLARILRMDVTVGERESYLTAIETWWGDERLSVRSFPEHSSLMLPLEALARRAGRDVKWDSERGTPLLDGVPVFGGTRLGAHTYFPHQRLEGLLSLQVHWEPGSLRAYIRS